MVDYAVTIGDVEAPAVPVNTVAPVVSGSTTVGSTLSCTSGTWTNSPTGYTYQWLQDGGDISGATSSTYTLVSGDIGADISCEVTASNGTGSGSPATSNAVGPVTAATFDYYISTTGSDSNVGSLASPWAITAINTKRSTYAGKRVGIITGTYGISSLMTTDAQDSGRNPALNINGGPDSSNLTVIAACDVSGNYSRGVVEIQADDNGTLGGNTASTNAMIGCNNTVTNRGNWVVDGIKFTGFSLWSVHIGTSPSGGAAIDNWKFQNCEWTGMSCATATNGSGVNVAPIIIYSSTDGTFTNCYFHDNVGGGTTDSAHFSCVYQWGLAAGSVPTSGTTFTYNTIVNSGGLHGKEGNQEGTTIAYNYIDWTDGPSGQNGSCIQGFDGAPTALSMPSYFHHNIFVCGGQGINIEAELNNGGWSTDIHVYNNTIITGTATGLVQYFRYFEESGGTNLLRFYNNIYHDNGHAPDTNYGYMLTNIGAFSVLDYNTYGNGGGSRWNTVAAGAHSSAGVTNRTFAGWQGAVNGGADANSDTTPPTFTNTGTYALQYTTTTGSAYQTGKVGGVSGGATVNRGAWDGIVTQIGADWVS